MPADTPAISKYKVDVIVLGWAAGARTLLKPFHARGCSSCIKKLCCVLGLLLPIHVHAASYTVMFDASAPLVAHVEADLPAGSSTLKMADWGGDPFPNGWASRVRHLAVISDGKPVTATLTPKAAKWTVTSDAPLHLAYDVDLSFAKEKWHRSANAVI